MQWEVNKWFGNPIFITKLENHEELNKEVLASLSEKYPDQENLIKQILHDIEKDLNKD